MIQNLRGLLQANFTKHAFKFRQSSRIDSLIKYWGEGVKKKEGEQIESMEGGWRTGTSGFPNQVHYIVALEVKSQCF